MYVELPDVTFSYHPYPGIFWDTDSAHDLQSV